MAEYREATQSLVALTQEALLDLLSRFNDSSDPAMVRDLLLTFFPDFMTVYGDTAAVLGADLYESLRGEVITASTVQSVFAQPAKVKQSEGVVRWAIGSLFLPEPDWSLFAANLLGAAQRLVMQPSRETIDVLARSDAAAGRVAAVGWTRHTHPERAQSRKSCDFCLMLEGRGPVYGSAETAGAAGATHYHDNCHCIPTPTFYELRNGHLVPLAS